jgi:hypothetical protein
MEASAHFDDLISRYGRAVLLSWSDESELRRALELIPDKEPYLKHIRGTLMALLRDPLADQVRTAAWEEQVKKVQVSPRFGYGSACETFSLLDWTAHLPDGMQSQDISPMSSDTPLSRQTGAFTLEDPTGERGVR